MNAAQRTSNIETSPSSTTDLLEKQWAQVGENVCTVLAMTRPEDQEKAVTSFAAHYEASPEEMRQAVSMYEFVAQIDDSRVRQSLSNYPFSTVEIVARWAVHHRKGAIKAARNLINGRYGLDTLAAAERAARRPRRR